MAIRAGNDSARLPIGDERFGLLDSMGDGVWDWNLQTGEVFYSDRWLESLGYSRSDVSGDIRFVADLIHPEDRELLDEIGTAHLEGRTDYFECEFRLRRKSGEYRWTLGRGRVLERNPEGRALRVLGANFDITARKLAELALQHAEGRCRTIVETTGCVVVVIDAQYRILEWNPAAERIYGWKQAEVRGKDYVAWFLPEEVRERVSGEIQRVLAGGEAEDYENPIVTRDGSERLLLWNARRLVDAEGRAWGVVGIGQDITGQKRAERQREISLREMEVLWERFRALRDLLPTCSVCDRVRDQDGNWSSPEAFLGVERPASGRHAICPECLGREQPGEG